MKKRSGVLVQRIALGVACVLIFSYTLYHLIGMFEGELSTYAAGITTETKAVSYTGYIFRDETVLRSENSGSVDYAVSDGTKVSEGQLLADVRRGGDAESRDYIARIDTQLRILEQSTAESLEGLDMSEVKRSVSGAYDTIVKMLAEDETGGLSAQTQSMLVGLNRIEGLAMGDEAQSKATAEALLSMRDKLLGETEGSQSCYAGQSGYFYSYADGYEEYFTMTAAKELTAGSFYRLLNVDPVTSSDNGYAYGKLSASNEWMLVMPIKASDADYFEVGSVYMGLFEENDRSRIPLTLENTVDAQDSGEVILVFSADRLPKNFTFNRSQSVRIELESVSGIYVPKNVVERMDGKRGVYILRGSVVHFRYIEVVHEGSDYYLVAPDVEADGERIFLQVNDMVIINGKNLFDGRVMD